MLQLPGFHIEGGGPWNFPPPPKKIETLYSVFARVWTINLMLTHQVLTVIHVSSKKQLENSLIAREAIWYERDRTVQ